VFVGPGAAAVGAASAPHFNPPKRYYLSLGDSLAFGYQDALFKQEFAAGFYDPADFPGYTAPFAERLTAIRPTIRTLNYGCPAETTASFIAGGCPFLGYGLPLHEPGAPAPQLQAALAVLRAHPGQVSPITLSLGANDLNDLFKACRDRAPATLEALLACVQGGLPGVLAGAGTNLGTILAALRAASPSSEIIVLLPYNPYALELPPSAAVVGALNATLADVATRYDARVADPTSTFNVATCSLTLMCTPQHDIHPSDVGYAQLAAALWAASGYDRLGGAGGR
jgi:lysophospholipase L1-like esterase